MCGVMKKRILVVDDEPDFTYMLKVGLEVMGYYNVAVENDPREAVRAAREFGPDLVLLDVMMPKVEGGEVAARLRSDPELRDVPVLFMTALVGPEDGPPARRGRGRGGHRNNGPAYLPKAMGTGELIEHIEDALATRKASIASDGDESASEGASA